MLDKLKYLHCLLSSVLPVVKQIHHEQASEVELEKRLHGKMPLMLQVALNLYWFISFIHYLTKFYIHLYFRKRYVSCQGKIECR